MFKVPLNSEKTFATSELISVLAKSNSILTNYHLNQLRNLSNKNFSGNV